MKITERALAQQYPGEWQRRFDGVLAQNCEYCPARPPVRTYISAYDWPCHVHLRPAPLPRDHILVSPSNAQYDGEIEIVEEAAA